MRCDAIEPAIEGLADRTVEPDADDRVHVQSCPVCSARVARARAIHEWLTTSDVPAPPASFTAGVMARVVRDRWRAEVVIDLGFNLIVGAGVLVILASGTGLAWSLGFLTVSIDLNTILGAIGSDITARVVSHVQTVAMSAVLLTMTLGLWWWAETGHGP